MGTTSTSTPESVLMSVRDTASVIADAQVEQLVQAVQWARLNPGDPDSQIEWGIPSSWPARVPPRSMSPRWRSSPSRSG